MSDYADDLRTNYGAMATDELLERVCSGNLTETAQEIASQELSQRGVAQPSEVEIRAFSKKNSERQKYRFIDAQNGVMPLWMAFWLGYVVVIGMVFCLSLVLIFDTSTKEFLARKLPVFIVIPQIYWAYCVWRCAWNVKTKTFGYIARFIAVLIGGAGSFVVALLLSN